MRSDLDGLRASVHRNTDCRRMASATAVKELEQRLVAADLLALVEKHRGNESIEALLGRFLVARDSNIDKAFTFLSTDLEWREEKQTLKYHTMLSSQVLEINGSLAAKTMLDEMVPIGYLGRDYQGRPVIYRKMAAPLDAIKLTTETEMTFERYFEYNIWNLERMAKIMGDEGQWVTIMDVGDLGFRHITRMHLQWAKVLADLMKDHFPERLGKSFVINAPAVFSIAWKIAKTWYDERMRQKIGIFAGEKSWKPEIAQIMDIAILPESLGGQTKLAFDPHSLDPGQSFPVAPKPSAAAS